MADSLDFSLTDDFRRFTAGSFDGTGAISLVAIVYPQGDTLDTGYRYVITYENLGPTQIAAFGFRNGQLISWNGSTEEWATFTVPALDEWYLIGMTKAAGSTIPRMHLYRYSTETWTHQNAGSTQAAFPDPSFISIPRLSGFEFDGLLLIAGCWDSALSDGTIETLTTDKAAWVAAAPVEAWRFNIESEITPFVGTSDDQYGEAGGTRGTLAAGEAPAGWLDGPSRTGTASQVDASAGNGSTSVTVPSDATGAVAFWSHWNGDTSGSLATLTLAGETFFEGYEVQQIEGFETNTPGIGVAFKNSISSTGSQTLAWTWSTSDARNEGGEIVIVWIKDQNTSDPVRDVAIDADAGTSAITVTLDTETTDLLLQFTQAFAGDPVPDGTAFISNVVLNSHHYSASEVAPDATSTTLDMLNENYSAMAAISLPAADAEEGEFPLMWFTAIV